MSISWQPTAVLVDLKHRVMEKELGES